ncbi:MAG: hypothetical protein KAJ51_17960, partial [Thermoplasmata archaeon]|nr:hypothetical protein [Thermoplasmata archaeon]
CRACGQKIELAPPKAKRVKKRKPIKKSKPIRKKPPPPPTPKPEAPPGYPKLGGTGAILTAIGAIIFGLMFTPVRIGDYNLWRMLIASSTILIATGCIGVAGGFLGLYRRDGQTLGILNVILALATAGIWFILSALIANAENLGSESINSFIIAIIISLLFSGVMLMVQGLYIYKIGQTIGKPQLFSTHAIISITAGAFCTTIIMVITYGVALYLWAVAYFLLLLVFLDNNFCTSKKPKR